MNGRLTLGEFSALAEDGEIDTVMVAVGDRLGRLRGLRIPARQFPKIGHTEMPFPADLLSEAAGSTAGHCDFVLRPDLSTLRRAAWVPGTALVIADLLDKPGGSPVPWSPRQMLKRQFARARERAFDVAAGCELDCTVFDQSAADIRRGGFLDFVARRDNAQTNSQRNGSAGEAVMRRLRQDLPPSNIPVDSTRASARPGGQTLALPSSMALEAADRIVIARHAAAEIGNEIGRAVSFLPKLYESHPGSACRVHLSLWSGRDPAFLDTSLPHGMSRLMRAFLGGMIRALDECTVFFAPGVNGYKRFGSGEAGMRKAWSLTNCGAAFRVCGSDTGAVRIECSVPGADTNPYLVLAALIAAGLDGIGQHLDCGDPVTGDMRPGGAGLPRRLGDAALALRGSAMLRAAMGDAVVDHHVRAALHEQEAFDRAVTDWEIARGF